MKINLALILVVRFKKLIVAMEMSWGCENPKNHLNLHWVQLVLIEEEIGRKVVVAVLTNPTVNSINFQLLAF